MKNPFIVVFILSLCVAQHIEDTIESHLEAITIAEAITYKNLKIYPLTTKNASDQKNFLTVDEALTKKWLQIKELGTGQVEFVEVKNNGKQMIFMMTGEVIRGAKQDRMIKEDVLVPPKGGWIRIPVYCVEHGRWVTMSAEFSSARLLVPNALRQRAKISESQTEVWDEIARSQEKLGIASATGTVNANYTDERVRAEITDYTKHFEHLPHVCQSAIGVVVTTGNRVICCDIFADNVLLKKLWAKLVKSYAMDALDSEKGSVDRQAIEDFITSLRCAHYISMGTPGSGQLFKSETRWGKGSALVYNGTVVHMDFFPLNRFHDDPELRLDIRRNQRLDD